MYGLGDYRIRYPESITDELVYKSNNHQEMQKLQDRI